MEDAGNVDPGIVDQHIQAAEQVDCGTNHGVDGSRVAHIHLARGGDSAGLLCKQRCFGDGDEVYVGTEDPSALLGEPDGRRSSDARASPGDDTDLAGYATAHPYQPFQISNSIHGSMHGVNGFET